MHNQPKAPSRGPFSFSAQAGAPMPIDSPFDADDGRWPSPGWPRSSIPGSPPYPNYWTDPFINLRAAAPNPFAAAPAPFSAAQLGALAWQPPIFPGDWANLPASNFPSTAWPTPPAPAPDSTSRTDPAAAPGWFNPQSLFPSLAPFAASARSSSIDNLGGLFSRDPSIPVGIFPDLPGSGQAPALPFGSGLFSGDPAASAPMAGIPGAFPAPGWPVTQSFLPPLSPLPSPSPAAGPAFDRSNGWSTGPTGSATAPMVPPRSVLFNRPPPDWDLGQALTARERDAATLDAGAQELGADGLPRSKSGAPVVPSAPQLAITPDQWLDAAHWLSPNLVDYFTKTLPPAPPFPPTPGKIPSTDNPYGPGAAIEFATWIASALERGIDAPLLGVLRPAEEAATEAALQAAKAATSAPALARPAEQIWARPYRELSGNLPRGFQAHHLNQNAVYGTIIPRNEGISVAMPGNIITEPGTPHYLYHRSLEQFLDQYRRGRSLESKMPTNAEYGEAGRRALIASGRSPAQALDLAARAAAQRAEYGLSETAEVPRIPRAIWPRRRD
jgi:hypothetical protein